MMYKRYVIFSLLAVLILSAFVFTDHKSGASGTLFAHAKEVVELCRDAPYRPACYDFEIPTLMDRGLSMEEAFAVTEIVQELDPAYVYCHVLGHYLSAKETAKDPLKWKDVVARAPTGICSNGAIHGAFQERFRVASLPDLSAGELKDELDGVCEPRIGWQPTGMEQATCTHALGHLAMYATDGAIPRSLSLCDLLVDYGGESMLHLCYDGVFMQLFQPLEPEDFALIEGKEIETKEEAIRFCSQFEGAERGSCTSESWPLWREELTRDPRAVSELCGRVGDDRYLSWRCYNGIFYVVAALSGLDATWVEGYCVDVIPEKRGQCFANAASRFVETDDRNIEKAAALCKTAALYGEGESCYRELVFYASYNFTPKDPKREALCRSIPDPWKETCLSGEAVQLLW